VDGKEVDHFSQHAAEWLNPRGAMKALHSLNQIRVPFIRDGLVAAGSVPVGQINTADVLKDLRILDVGCGAGILSVPLARLGARVTGLDASENLVEAANKNRDTLNPQVSERLEFQTGTIEEHVLGKAENYDAVVASEVIEHVNDPASFLRSCILSLKVRVSKHTIDI
jgi:polyprenyldihydroxybenzoate methyltransferase / 3-demethylubiquinol 3-O-methyltransferase